MKKLRELSLELSALSVGPERCFTLADLVAKSTSFGISELDVEVQVKAWKQDGTIYEPTDGEYRFA